MRLPCLVLLTTLLLPGLCLAEPPAQNIPAATDDIANMPAVTQPAPSVNQPNQPDDSVEIVMPATTVRGLPEVNATLPAVNGTIPEENTAVNATLPVFNATLPSMNATLPTYNATLPAIDANATLPTHNATLPEMNVNATLPVHNATLPVVQVNATQPVVNVSTPAVNATQPRVLTVADFLVKAPKKITDPEPQPEKSPPPKAAPAPKESAKAQPAKNAPTKPEPAKAPAKEPAKPEPQKTEPPKSGQGLKIPPEAVKTGDVSFLEGCWRGYRPEYSSKRMITERFCFNASGVGKRTIKDPAYAGDCYGATRALLNKDGVLHMTSEQAVCTSGEIWGGSEMICKGEGAQTPCSWKFTDANNASQAYKISFVRE